MYIRILLSLIAFKKLIDQINLIKNVLINQNFNQQLTELENEFQQYIAKYINQNSFYLKDKNIFNIIGLLSVPLFQIKKVLLTLTLILLFNYPLAQLIILLILSCFSLIVRLLVKIHLSLELRIFRSIQEIFMMTIIAVKLAEYNQINGLTNIIEQRQIDDWILIGLIAVYLEIILILLSFIMLIKINLQKIYLKFKTIGQPTQSKCEFPALISFVDEENINSRCKNIENNQEIVKQFETLEPINNLESFNLNPSLKMMWIRSYLFDEDQELLNNDLEIHFKRHNDFFEITITNTSKYIWIIGTGAQIPKYEQNLRSKESKKFTMIYQEYRANCFCHLFIQTYMEQNDRKDFSIILNQYRYREIIPKVIEFKNILEIKNFIDSLPNKILVSFEENLFYNSANFLKLQAVWNSLKMEQKRVKQFSFFSTNNIFNIVFVIGFTQKLNIELRCQNAITQEEYEYLSELWEALIEYLKL